MFHHSTNLILCFFFSLRLIIKGFKIKMVLWCHVRETKKSDTRGENTLFKDDKTLTLAHPELPNFDHLLPNFTISVSFRFVCSMRCGQLCHNCVRVPSCVTCEMTVKRLGFICWILMVFCKIFEEESRRSTLVQTTSGRDTIGTWHWFRAIFVFF